MFSLPLHCNSIQSRAGTSKLVPENSEIEQKKRIQNQFGHLR